MSRQYPAVYDMKMIAYLTYAISVDGVQIGTVTMGKIPGVPQFTYEGNGVTGTVTEIRDAVRALWDAYQDNNGGGQAQ